MNKSKIDWPGLDYLWNPIVGCKRGCQWCVVRNRVWPRIRHLYGNNDFGVVTPLPERLDDPGKIKKSSTFFCGFYTDIRYCPPLYMLKILEKVRQYSQHTFMFLSKDVVSYPGYDWPENSMQGLTMTGEAVACSQQLRIDVMTKLPRPWISIEPLLETLDVGIPEKFERVIVGAMTGKDAVPPSQAAIESIRKHCRPEVVHWKKNIKPFL